MKSGIKFETFMPTSVVFWYKKRLLFKIISQTKKVEFTLSSKIIQAACLFLFPGSVSKLSFDRIIIDEIWRRANFASKLIGVQSIFWASIKPGRWNIPEHSGTSRNMKKLKYFFMKK